MSLVTLTWLLPDGRAAGRGPDGRIVRVAGALPGDVVGPAGDGGGFTVVEPGPERRVAPCAWSAACGGCDLDGLEPDARRRALGAMVGHAFGWEGTVPVVPSTSQESSRARIKLGLSDGRVGYRPARSHDIVEIGSCRIARPELQGALEQLRGWLSVERTQGLSSVELRSDGSRVVYAFTSSGSVPRAVRDALGELGDVALDGRRIAGNPVLTLEVLGTSLQIRPNAFYQVNLEVNEALAAHVRSAAVDRQAERAVDLYAGIGNLTLPLAEAGIPVVAVEAPGAGLEDLRANTAGRNDVEVVSRRVERFDFSRVAFDTLVLDPPRAGARGVLASAQRNRPRTVIYVSCHAPSAARDLKELDGYRLVDLTCFELFVDSRHVEAVVVLERG